MVEFEDADNDYDDGGGCEWCGDTDMMCNCDAGLACVCGAYVRTKDGHTYHIADCICGAE